MICSGVYPFLTIYPPFYEIITGIVLGGHVNLTYEPVGSRFEFTLRAYGLQRNTDYSLIYYADPWPGNNPGALIVSANTNWWGSLYLRGSTELNMDLPHPDDANYAPPCACDPCPGAKIWLVPSSDYNADTKAMVGWNPSEYLFEYNSITYNDTEVS